MNIVSRKELLNNIKLNKIKLTLIRNYNTENGIKFDKFI